MSRALAKRINPNMSPSRWAWWKNLPFEEMILRIRLNRCQRKIKAYKAILTDIGWDEFPALGISLEHKKIKEIKAMLPKGSRIG